MSISNYPPVILNSGGPIMNLETIEGENAVASWDDRGKVERSMFSVVCLSALVPLSEYHWPRPSVGRVQ